MGRIFKRTVKRPNGQECPDISAIQASSMPKDCPLSSFLADQGCNANALDTIELGIYCVDLSPEEAAEERSHRIERIRNLAQRCAGCAIVNDVLSAYIDR